MYPDTYTNFIFIEECIDGRDLASEIDELKQTTSDNTKEITLLKIYNEKYKKYWKVFI